ncbi:MAG: A/G-specific adenine glycosylase [Elstera sp.]
MTQPAHADLILTWYDHNRRRLPWRAEPGEIADPYHVWLSEVMLQQTTVQTVADYYRRFLARWPTVQDLAQAPLDDVLTEWAGLGYYARARNLHKCAAMVVARHRGVFPADEEALRLLPGIGDYTAAAIAAIAFDRPAAVMDGNIERVVSRLFAVAEPLPGAKPRLKALVAELTPQARPGDYAQAMMDLGSMVCTPRRPTCGLCPVSSTCVARISDDPERFPVKTAKPDKPTRYGAVFWLTRKDGAVLLRRRAETGLLGGMMEVPGTDWRDAPPSAPLAAAPLKLDWQKCDASVRHTFTHFHLELQIYRGAVGLGDPKLGTWITPDRFGEVAVPTLFRKVAKAVLGR